MSAFIRDLRYPRAFVLMAVLASTLLAGCGGSDSTPADPSEQGEPAPTSSGSINGFGSIIVNGIRFDDSTASVLVDGESANTTALRLGMIADVHGSVDEFRLTGVAERIEVHTAVRGRVTAVDAGGNDLHVLGIRVVPSAGVTWDGFTQISDLNAGDVVEVYGYADAQGNVTATRIEREDSNLERVRLLGPANSATASEFQIGNVRVEYDGDDAERIPGGVVTNDMRVRVRGTLTAQSGDNFTVTAEEVRQADRRLQGDAGQLLELEGVVTAFRSDTDFDVNGLQVTVSVNAEREGTVQEGAIVEVEGTLTDNVLLASKVEVETDRRMKESEVTGAIDDVIQAGRTFTMRGGQVRVRWTAATRFDDGLGPDGANLTDGLVAEVEGALEGDALVAERIRRADDRDEFDGLEAEGILSNLNVSSQRFTLHNGRLTVTWTTSTEFDDDNLPDQAGSLANGQRVEVEGRLEQGVLVASRIDVDD